MKTIRNFSFPLIIFCLFAQGCVAPIAIIAFGAIPTAFFGYKNVQLSTGGSAEVKIKEVKLSEEDQKALASLKTLAVYPGDIKNIKMAEALSIGHNLNVITPLVVQKTLDKKGMGRDFLQMTQEEKMRHAKDVCQILNADGILFFSEGSMSADISIWSLKRTEMTTKFNSSVFSLKNERMIWSLEDEIVWKIGSHVPPEDEKVKIVVSSVTEKFLSDAGKRTVTLRPPAGQVVEEEVPSLVSDNMREGQVIPTSPPKSTAAQPPSSSLVPKDTQAADVPPSQSLLGHLIVIKTANVRAAANEKSKIIDTLKKGEKVENLGSSGNWFNVKLSSGSTGWVFKDLVKATK